MFEEVVVSVGSGIVHFVSGFEQNVLDHMKPTS